jgi:hypothetical protein
MNESSVFAPASLTTTRVKVTAIRAWPTTFVVLERPSERCRRILIRSSTAPTMPRPTATPSTARPATVIWPKATPKSSLPVAIRPAAYARTIPVTMTTPPMVGVPIFSRCP